jgi:hypothetical protein
MPDGEFETDGSQILEAISKLLNGPISLSGLNRNPQNISIYSSGYDSAPSSTSNHFSNFEMASNKRGSLLPMKGR